MLGEAYPRVQRHRSRDPQKRLCRRRAAASPGAACKARLRSRRSLTTCGEEELVRQVHTLFVRSEQQVAVYELQVLEKEEKVRTEVQEIEGESKVKRNAHMNMDHVDGVKDSLLEPRCMCA